MQSLFYGLGLFVTALTAWGFFLGGWGYWLGVLFLFGLVPLLEFFFPKWELKTENKATKIADGWIWTSPVYLSALLLFAGFCFLKVSDFFSQLGLILSTGVVIGGFGITYAHELVHRARASERALGVWNLLLVNFAFWGVEHVFGHHKNVGTPEDGATAHKNQNLYAFFLQDYFQGLSHSWKFESTRLKNAKKSWLFHRILLYWIFSALSTGVLAFGIGLKAVLFWWSVSFIAIFLLIAVDYIEHYGLQRKKRDNGLYEPVQPAHSWDSASVLTNLILANLGLHAHHHMKARLPFQELEMQKGAKILPYGYSVMVAAALIPPLFFKIVNPQLERNL